MGETEKYESLILSSIWIILVIISVFALLVYLGIISFQNNCCSLSGNIGCSCSINHKGYAVVAVENKGEIILQNATLAIEEPCIPSDINISNHSIQFFECNITKGLKGMSYSHEMVFDYSNDFRQMKINSRAKDTYE